jgi:arsenite methyltransferase
VLRRRQLVRDAIAPAPGEAILDVGCGPGFYVAELLEQVGPEGAVVGVDASPDMLAMAARRSEDHDNVAFHQADATSLPVDDESFDAAFSVQVLEYVEDATAALAEMRRALRAGGRVVVWDVDWGTVSLRTTDPARSERVLQAWDAHLMHPSLPQTLTARLRDAGFEDVAMQAHVFATNEFDPETYGGFLVPFAAQFVVERELIDEDEAKAWEEEQRELGERGEFFFTVTQFCFTARRPA